jgi:flagellar protein FliS
MYNPNFASTQNNRLNQYLVSEVLDATPQQIIIKIYEFAILNCSRNDLLKTNNAIQELINALRFDDEKAKEISIGLFNLYRFCQEEMRKGNNETVRVILTELRDTWVNALKNYKG